MYIIIIIIIIIIIKGISVCDVTWVRKNGVRRDKRGRECESEAQLKTEIIFTNVDILLIYFKSSFFSRCVKDKFSFLCIV